MARKRKRTSRRRTVRARRAPARRRTPARSYRRRRRSNPKGITQTPAFRFAAATGAGAAAAELVLPRMFPDGPPDWLPDWLPLPVLAGLLTALAVPMVFRVKGKNRGYLIAAGTGMMIPTGVRYLGEASADMGTSTSQITSGRRRRRQIAPDTRTRTAPSSASRSRTSSSRSRLVS